MIEIENEMPAEGPDGIVQLATYLAQALGTAVDFRFLSHGYHWNVKGIEFQQLHEFFGDIYDNTNDSIDDYAESLRRLAINAPYFLDDFKELTVLPEQQRIDGDALQMLHSLYYCNMEFLALLRQTYDAANAADEQGIATFIADRIDIHSKWEWQIRSMLNLDAGI
jgi:starvation-inducible DNA-binding protein